MSRADNEMSYSMRKRKRQRHGAGALNHVEATLIQEHSSCLWMLIYEAGKKARAACLSLCPLSFSEKTAQTFQAGAIILSLKFQEIISLNFEKNESFLGCCISAADSSGRGIWCEFDWRIHVTYKVVPVHMVLPSGVLILWTATDALTACKSGHDVMTTWM